MAADYSTGAAIFLFFLLTLLLNPLAHLLTGSRLHSGELATIYIMILVFSSLWAARQHIGDVLRKAFKRDPTIDDSGEMLSYRTAVLGFIFGSIFAVWWLAQTGLQFGIALFYFLLCLATFIGLARIVSQAGLAYGVSPVAPPVFMVTALGPTALGASGLTALGMVLGAFGSAGMWLIIDYFGGMSNWFTM